MRDVESMFNFAKELLINFSQLIINQLLANAQFFQYVKFGKCSRAKLSTMKFKIFTSLFIIFFNIKSYGQFLDKDVIITTKGLSEEYATRFKENSNKEALISTLNQLGVTHSIAPIKVTVSYEKEEGNVIAEINYNHDTIFSTNSNYSSHNSNWNRFGTGISVFLQDQIFTALSQYKKSVATKGYLMDKDLLKFESVVKLKKSNGDWISFFAYNFLDSRGFYPFMFYHNVYINIKGKEYSTETSNAQMLKEMRFFKVGKTTGLDGNKTGASYFCQFFNIKNE